MFSPRKTLNSLWYHAFNETDDPHLRAILGKILRMTSGGGTMGSKAEPQLAQIVNLLQEVFSRLDLGIVVLNQEALVVSCNTRAAELMEDFFMNKHSKTIPVKIKRWIQPYLLGLSAGRPAKGPSKPLLVSQKVSFLVIHFLPNPIHPLLVLFRCNAGLKSKWGLTAREAEVMVLLARGFNSPDIARALEVSKRTIDAHLQHIFRKMKVQTRHAATMEYLQIQENMEMNLKSVLLKNSQ